MDFLTPRGEVKFTIPDEWWHFADMSSFDRGVGESYPPCVKDGQTFETVWLNEIEPPVRTVPGLTFRKYKLMPVLFAFNSPECALPLVEISARADGGPYKYNVVNGYHRYYASIAAGFRKLPVVIR
jgi:hypothetical protein